MRLLLLLCFLAGCFHQYQRQNLEFRTLEPVQIDNTQAFANTLHPFLVKNCKGCHGKNQRPLFATPDSLQAEDEILAADIIDLDSPANSYMVRKITSGHKGFTIDDAQSITELIQAWSENIKPY